MAIKWMVEFTVSDNWIDGGFDLTEERALRMIQSELPFANESEISAAVVDVEDAKEKQ